MAMHAKYPADDEIACFYALALLGTGAARRDKTRATRCRRRRSSQDIFERHPQHPGAAHYIIHSFDDPDHAILSADGGARLFEDRAVGGARAPHAVAHLRPARDVGRRDRVERRRLQGRRSISPTPKNLPRGREDFHTLSWLQYAYLQEGKFDEAQKCVDQAKAVADKDTAANIRDGYAAMKARQVVESEQWEKLALPTGAVKDGGAPGYDGSAAYVLAAGLERRAARRSGDRERRARQAEGDAERRRRPGSNAYRAKPFAIMAKEVGAGDRASAQKNTADAERLLKEATAIERRSTRRRDRPSRSSRRSSSTASSC